MPALSRYVLSSKSTLNATYRALVKSVACGDYAMEFTRRTNGRNVGDCEFYCRPVFLSQVSHVVSVTAKEQMMWIYAASIVAAMKDVLTIWNRVAEQLKTQSMRVHGTLEHIQNSIPESVDASGPGPTDIRVVLKEVRSYTSMQLLSVLLLIHGHLIIPGSGGMYA